MNESSSSRLDMSEIASGMTEHEHPMQMPQPEGGIVRRERRQLGDGGPVVL